MQEFFGQLSVWVLPVFLAVVLHELAHGVAAYRLGDRTALQAGRLTLNPLAHVDPMGTIVVPLLLILFKSPFLFGWAKPVPINPSYLKDPKRDMIWIGLAGPATNLLIAVASALLLKFFLVLRFLSEGVFAEFGVSILVNSAIINVVLAVFNALPIPPLDGGKILAGLLPSRQVEMLNQIEPYGFLILMLLLMSGMLGTIIGPFIQVFLRILF
tara:strand:- start:277 stop:915 length:639 start_codon:yes stop_codon:yes gene_type:complete